MGQALLLRSHSIVCTFESAFISQPHRQCLEQYSLLDSTGIGSGSLHAQCIHRLITTNGQLLATKSPGHQR